MGDKTSSSEFILPFSTSTLDAFLDKYPAGVIFTNEAGKILYYNETITLILGITNGNYIGSNINDIICTGHNQQQTVCLTKFLSENSSIVAGEKIKLSAIKSNGKEVPLSVSCNLITEQKQALVFYVIEDISQQVDLQQKLYEQTITDPLTGVFNRR